MFATLLAVAMTGQIISQTPPKEGDTVAIINPASMAIPGWSEQRLVDALRTGSSRMVPLQFSSPRTPLEHRRRRQLLDAIEPRRPAARKPLRLSFDRWQPAAL